jgi:zinc protease
MPPVEGSLRHFEIPTPDERFLPSGNFISHYQRNSIPLIQVILSYPKGTLDEKANKGGLINLLCSVLDEGTKNKTSLEFSDEVEFLGSSLSIQTDYERLIISLQSLGEKFEETLKLLHEMLQQPRFDVNDFEREKNNIVVRLRQAQDLPDAIAERAYRSIVYKNIGNYGNPIHGSIASLSGIDLPQVESWYQNNLQQCSPDVFSAGDIGIDELQQHLEKYRVLKDSATSSPKKSFSAGLPESRIFIIDKPESVQTELIIGHLTNSRTDDDYFAKVILNMIFGGQFTSRLNLNLREKNGLTYGVHSSFNYQVHAGDFQVTTSVASADTGKAVREILNESARISDDITQDEIDFTKASLVNRFTLNFETFGQLVGNSYSRYLFGLPADYFENYIAHVMAVKTFDVQAAAARRICVDKYQIVLVGNFVEIEKSLSQNGIEIPMQKIANESLW